MKKKILIASSGYADIPIIKAAKKLGLFVITSGFDEKGLGIPYSDLYCKADNSDKEAILSIAKESRVHAICPGAAGTSPLSCSYAAEHLGFKCIDSYKISKILHIKDSFKKFTKENNIPSPEATSFNNIKMANKAIDKFKLIINNQELKKYKIIDLRVSNQIILSNE